MKFATALVSFGLVIGTFAQQGFRTFAVALDQMLTKSELLEASYKSYTPAAGGANLLAAADDLVLVINSGVAAISGISQLGWIDSLSITVSIECFAEVVGLATAVAIRREAEYAAEAGLADSLLASFGEQKTVYDALLAVSRLKVDPGSVHIVDEQVYASEKLQDAIDAYSD
jgi:hypothetical protein